MAFAVIGTYMLLDLAFQMKSENEILSEQI